MARGLVLLGALLGGCGGGSTAAPPLAPVEQNADLGIVRADVPTELTVLVPNPLDVDAAVTESLPPAPPFLDAPGIAFGDVAAGDSLEVRLVFTPPAPGTYATAVGLLFGTREVRLTVQVTAEDAQVEFTGVDFGEMFEGDERTLAVTVRNPNAATPIDVGAADPLPPGFSIAGLPRTLAPGESADLPLTYAPLAMGVDDFDLRVASSLGALAAHVAAKTTWGRIYTDFGNVALTGGLTDWLLVDVPADGASLTIEAVLATPGGTISLAALEGPGGHVYPIDHSVPGSLRWSSSSLFAFTLPCSDRAAAQLVVGGGTYRFRLSLNTTTPTISVRTIVQTRPGGIANAGKLDLNVFLAAGLGIADPGNNAPLQAALAYADQILGQKGLHLGKISYFTLDAVYDQVSNLEFEDLYKSSSIAPETRMNVFLVQEVYFGYLGVAGQIDGPARNGTRASGVLVDYDAVGPTGVGRTMAHEIGHYLGLIHTTEANSFHDEIDDTLECPASGTDSVCTTDGAGYLMHWLYLGGDENNVITDGQAHVILGHPLVRPTAPAPPPNPMLLSLAADDPTPLPAFVCGCDSR